MSHGGGDTQDFDHSPRPVKRQRISKAENQAPKVQEAPIKAKRGRPRKPHSVTPSCRASDEEGLVRSAQKRISKRSAKPSTNASASGNDDTTSVTAARKTRRITRAVSPASSLDEDAFEPAPELRSLPRAIRALGSPEEDGPKPKKPKHHIHVPTGHDLLRDRFVSQVPPDSSDPNSIRGPIWIARPANKHAPPPPPLFNQSSTTSYPDGSALTTKSSTTSKVTQQRQDVRLRHGLPAAVDEASAGRENVLAAMSKLPIADKIPPHLVEKAPATVTKFSAVVQALPTMSSEVIDLADELADLPSDAFMSSPERTSPAVSRQVQPPNKSKGFGTGYRQMTLHGSFSDPKDAAQTKTKKPHQVDADRSENPTQHKLNEDALSKWVYPINLGTVRDYQYNIVQNGLFHNLLVALPTGLGKTFIAATIMLNWYRWTKDAQIIFVAPTKPLVAQQIEACFHTVGIPRSDTAMLTGTVSPAMRAEAWETKRVFFMTPQTMGNDLRSGICDPKRVVLLVVDEAHRATGHYAYVDIVKFLRRFNQSFRVLALTATPGSKVDTVQEVIDGLDIARTEIRTENSLDIRRYVYSRETETFTFEYSEEQEMIMELFSKALQPILDKLKSQNATWMTNPRKISAYGLTISQRDWSKSEAGRNASWPVKSMVSSSFKVLSSLAHAMTMLKFHGVGPFFRKIASFRREVDEADKSMKAALQIRNSESFNRMYNYVSTWIKNPDFIGHPKLEYLRSVILNHFLDRGETGIAGAPSATRVMVFAQYRDSAEEIVRVLKRNEPMIRPRVFVGQAHAEGSAGMDQKTQLSAIEQFKAGTFNTLVATSIGEEGLDIGEVDLIICYDANASPIRMLQRMGRTGRKRAGKIVLLLMKEKEVDDFEKSKDNYEKMQGLIANGAHFKYHDDRSPRILPNDIKPVVDKCVVEIPVENSQTDLPIPTKRTTTKKKKPPKKFHMPEGVITGFVKATKVRENGSDIEISELEEEAPINPKGNRKSIGRSKSNISLPRPEPEGVPLPFLEDVLLNRMQERELERKYQYVADQDEATVVQAPEPEKNLGGFKKPSTVVSVQHSPYTMSISSLLASMHNIDGVTIERYREHLHMSDLVIPAATDDFYGDPNAVHEENFIDSDDSSSFGSITAPVTIRKTATTTKKRGPPTKAKAAAAPQNTRESAPTRAVPGKKVAAALSKRSSLQRVSSAMEAASSSPPPTPDDMRLPSQGIALGDADTSGEEAEDTDRWHDDSELDGFVVGSDEDIEMVSSSLPFVPGDSTPGPRRGDTNHKVAANRKGDSKADKGKRRRLLRGGTTKQGKGKEIEGRKELSEEFVVESDEEEVMDDDGDEEEDDDDTGVLGPLRGGFNPALDEGISAEHRHVGGKRRRVIESDSDE
ncbi:hypothetical protein CAC42_2856 [Sphaceloma murrayae]|uniref:ATP-dependent DNA helicase n=1 Tax=Sphaceloma murrayae TaxID=2082308 RepID=A0A2K1R0V6_9PEZI|nr:hypothetical protein CAC42_2856 [Sphaceloma murrayae]